MPAGAASYSPLITQESNGLIMHDMQEECKGKESKGAGEPWRDHF